MRVAVDVLGREPDDVEQLAHARRAIVARSAPWMRSGSAMIDADAHARVQRGVRVLEDHLHLAPQRPQLAPRQRGDVRALELASARRWARCRRSRRGPSVDLPQPDSPTSPSVSPARTSRLTPSTARTLRRPRAAATPLPRTREVLGDARRPRAATAQRSRSRRRLRRRIARRAARASSIGQVAGVEVPGAALSARAAARSCTARSGAGSAAANTQPGGGVRAATAACPAIAGEPPRPRPVERAGSSRAAPTCTGAAGRGRSSRVGPCSTIRPPYITSTRSAISATTPRSWVISTTAEPGSSLQRRGSGRGSGPGS